MKKTNNSKLPKQPPKSKPVKNNFTDSLGFDIQSFGVQLSQLDTAFKNNRWYLISNIRQLLSEMYIEHGIIRNLCSIPVTDALRGGINIKTQMIDPDDVEALQSELEQKQDIETAGQAEIWNRLFGGAGLIVMQDQDPSLPFTIDSINENSDIDFRASDMWELFTDKQNVEGFNPKLVMQSPEFYRYYSLPLHHSRVMVMKGLIAPSFIRPRLRGWGFSVIECSIRSLNQYLKATDLAFQLLDEFKLDVFKFKGLAQLGLDADAMTAVRARVQMANQQKNFQNAIVLDTDDDFGQKQVTFSGFADIMREIRYQFAADNSFPVSKIFGLPSSGFSSGQDDLENYNGMIESTIRPRLRPTLRKVIQIRAKQMFGITLDDLQIDFHPLRILSAEQEETVKTQKFARLIQAKTAGEIDALEFRDACNKDNLLGVQLERDNLDVEEGVETTEESANQPEKTNIELPKNHIPWLERYTIDGGDEIWENEYNKFVENPGKVDEPKWKEAKEAATKEGHSKKWPLVTYIYKKMGGTFS